MEEKEAPEQVWVLRGADGSLRSDISIMQKKRWWGTEGDANVVGLSWKATKERY